MAFMLHSSHTRKRKETVNLDLTPCYFVFNPNGRGAAEGAIFHYRKKPQELINWCRGAATDWGDTLLDGPEAFDMAMESLQFRELPVLEAFEEMEPLGWTFAWWDAAMAEKVLASIEGIKAKDPTEESRVNFAATLMDQVAARADLEQAEKRTLRSIRQWCKDTEGHLSGLLIDPRLTQDRQSLDDSSAGSITL